VRRSRNRFPSKYLLPLLALTALVWALPLLMALALSFSDASPGAPGHWVGLQNFVRALGDIRFIHAFFTGVLFAVGAVAFNVGAGLGLALVFRRHEKPRALAQVMLLLPWVLSELAVALIWRDVLAQNGGLVNALLGRFGIGPLPWQTHAWLAMGSLWLATLWQGLAFSTMLQMAGLASLPHHLVHAAKLDGADRPLIFRAVVWPHLRRVLAANALLVFLLSLVTFSLPFALTGGGPLFATELPALYAYRSAFAGNFELGYAAAQGMLVLVFYAVLTALFLRLRRRTA